MYFRHDCDKERVKNLCNILIRGKRGKTLGREIIKQMDQNYLNKATYDRLSRWVNPERAEAFAQPIAEDISIQLFGEAIQRV